MYFTDDSLLPENQAPLMITAAPYGPMWLPGDCTPEQKLPVTWEEQTQIAVDCYNAGAAVLHIHVRDPKTGHISKNFKEYADQIGRLRQAVPKMILRVGGSISFAPEPGEEAKFQSYDSRHKLAEIDPRPDQVTVLCGTGLFDLTALHPHVRMARELGRAIATPEEARQMLKIGVTYKSTEETLANLGLPPNRRPGHMGFMVHETDGKFHPAAQGGCGHIHAGEWENEVVKPKPALAK